MKNVRNYDFVRLPIRDYLRMSLLCTGWAAICILIIVLSDTIGLAQQNTNTRGGGQGGPGRGGGPGGGFPGGGFPGGGNTTGRPGFPGGGPGGGFPGGGNTTGRPGFPGGGFSGGGNTTGRPGFPGGGPGGGFPGGGFPGVTLQQRPTTTNVATSASTNLVPPFGETVVASPAVLRFGESAETTQVSTAVRNAVTAADEDLQRRINEQAQQLMTRYDRDRNGMIERSTGEWNNVSFDANAVDANRDGRITLDELRVYVGNQLRGGTSGAKVFTYYATTYQHMPEGIPTWFTERDKDNDGQLTLFEYANGQPIIETMLAEFEWLDLNNDGIATLAECYSAIKTKEEMERKALEEQGIVQGGNARGGTQDRRGGNNPNAPGETFVPGTDRQSSSGTGRSTTTRPTPGATPPRYGMTGGPGGTRGARGGGGAGNGAGGRGRGGG